MSRPKSAVPPHVFTADLETPGDPISGDEVCARCRCLGRPDDARHTMPEPAPDAQSRAAGEKEVHRT